MTGTLGRLVPHDWNHYDKHPLTVEQTASVAERSLSFYDTWRTFYDQGREGACVGFSSSQMMTILNRRRYDAKWLWDRAKEIDEWSHTNPGDDNGTSVRASMDILRQRGHRYYFRGELKPESIQEGIEINTWANTVDQLRTCIQSGIPVVMGTNWYSNFDTPELVDKEYWLGRGELGRVRGGHAYMFHKVSDRRQAFFTPNSWGNDWPEPGAKGAWVPFDTIQRLINENGEATVVVDRI
jgi:hypothetical protein